MAPPATSPEWSGAPKSRTTHERKETIATLAITVTAGNEAGASFRKLAQAIIQAASVLPDKNATGASTVLTIDNAPATGVASAQITSGPITNASAFIA